MRTTVWGRRWVLAPVVLAGLWSAACSSGDDAAARDSLTPLPAMASPDTTDEPDDTASSTAADTVASSAPGPSTTVPVPPFQAPDCGDVTGDELFSIVAAFRSEVDGRSGFTIAVAGAIDDADGVRYVVGSIYDSTGFRVGPAETWAVVDDELYAISRGALEHSTLPDGREVLDGPDQGGESPVRAMLEACVSDAR